MQCTSYALWMFCSAQVHLGQHSDADTCSHPHTQLLGPETSCIFRLRLCSALCPHVHSCVGLPAWGCEGWDASTQDALRHAVATTIMNLCITWTHVATFAAAVRAHQHTCLLF